MSDLVAKVSSGGRIDAAEALELYRNAPTHLLGRLADGIRARKHPGRIVTYIIDRNVNYTNVCVARCNFCALYRPVGSAEGYVHSPVVIVSVGIAARFIDLPVG